MISSAGADVRMVVQAAFGVDGVAVQSHVAAIFIVEEVVPADGRNEICQEMDCGEGNIV